MPNPVDVLSADEWQIVWLTLGVAARAVGFGLPVAIAVSLLLARGRFPGRAVLDTLVHLPLVLPPVVVGWLLLLMFGLRGPVGAWLQAHFGLRLVFTTPGAALACAVMSFPLMVRAIRLSLEAVDPGLVAASRTLGAGVLDRLVSVILPLALPGVVVGAITAFAACLGEFGAVSVVSGHIRGQTNTMPLHIEILYNEYQFAAAFAVASLSRRHAGHRLRGPDPRHHRPVRPVRRRQNQRGRSRGRADPAGIPARRDGRHDSG